MVVDKHGGAQLLRGVHKHLERLRPRHIIHFHVRVLRVGRQQVLDECCLACAPRKLKMVSESITSGVRPCSPQQGLTAARARFNNGKMCREPRQPCGMVGLAIEHRNSTGLRTPSVNTHVPARI